MMPITELDIISAKQWVVSCRLIFASNNSADFSLIQKVQNAVNKLVEYLPTLGGELDFSRKIITLDKKKIRVKFIQLQTESFNPDNEFDDNQFIQDLEDKLFSVCLTKVLNSRGESWYILGTSFSHGIVDACGMYKVTNALSLLIDNINAPIKLTDDRNLVYKYFPIVYKNYDDVTKELQRRRLNPMYFGTVIIGAMMEKAVISNIRTHKERIVFKMNKKSNIEMCKEVVNKYAAYYDYSKPVIGQIYDARNYIPEFTNYIGNLSYLMTYPVIEDIDDTIDIINDKIREEATQYINLYENALYNNYYIPNIDIEKQTIMTNSHVDYFPIIKDTKLFNKSPYRLLTHNIGDCILFSQEKEGEIKCYVGEQYGRSSISSFHM